MMLKGQIMSRITSFNPFLVNVSILYPLKTPGTIASGVSGGIHPFLANIPILHPRKTKGFLVFSGGIKQEYWPKWVNTPETPDAIFFSVLIPDFSKLSNFTHLIL